jgi:hypothetical protein
MSKTKHIILDAELVYAKVFEHNRDMGVGAPESIKKARDATDGLYMVDLIIDDRNKAILEGAGVPDIQKTYDRELEAFQQAEGIEDRDMAEFKFSKTDKGGKLAESLRLSFKYRETGDGNWKISVKRPHFNPKMPNDDGGVGKVMGPPKVVDGSAEPIEVENGIGEVRRVYPDWDDSVLLGNHTKAKVRLSVYKGAGTIVNLEAIAVKELVDYATNDDYVGF